MPENDFNNLEFKKQLIEAISTTVSEAISEAVTDIIGAAIEKKFQEYGCPRGVTAEHAAAIKELAQWWSGMKADMIKSAFSFLVKLIIAVAAIGAAVSYIITKKIG